eukprot:1177301-Ditylum_brightwellii.AAC.1
MGYLGDTLLCLNRCRLHLHVLTLSNVVTGDACLNTGPTPSLPGRIGTFGSLFCKAMPVTANWISFLLVRGTPFHIVPHDGGIQAHYHYFTTNPLVDGTSITLYVALLSVPALLSHGQLLRTSSLISFRPQSMSLWMGRSSLRVQRHLVLHQIYT